MALTGFARDIDIKIAAGYQAMVVSTEEQPRVIDALTRVAESLNRPLLIWRPADGFEIAYPHPGTDSYRAMKCHDWAGGVLAPDYIGDVGVAIGALIHAADFPAECLVLILAAHELLAAPHDAAAITRSALACAVTTNALVNTRQQRPIVFAHPPEQLHPYLDTLLEPVNLPLPTPAEIAGPGIDQAAAGIPADTDGRPAETGLDGPAGELLRQQLGAVCAGLTHNQIQNVLSEGLVIHGKFTPEMRADVQRCRDTTIDRSGLIKSYHGPETFADVAGLDDLKRFLSRLARIRPDYGLAPPRGVLLIGVPGVGKTLLARALAHETGRRALALNVGNVLGSHVGQSEAQIREALRLVDGSGSNVLLLDELEKAVAGSVDGSQSDGGVMSRLMSELLRWLEDHTTDFFAVGCVNTVESIPPELTRSGRFNAAFFLDVPLPAEQEILWPFYLRRYGLDPDQPRPAGWGWTGADIKNCCEMAHTLESPIVEAARYLIPTIVSHAGKIGKIREWAENKCLDATLGDVYSRSRREAAIKEYAEKPVATQPRAIRKRSDPSRN